MDYNSLKKLAVVMGEEFKVLDSVTLEAINVQRLITKEKEYCSTLEELIQSHDCGINAIENEAKSLKYKLEEAINKGLLLKSSLESLKSSHKMVELLKVDLKKQLQLEMIKTTEQNIKFDSTIKKYEEMWENYKLTYQKFPLVFDLHKIQSKLKQKSIQLAIQEKNIEDCKTKIEVLSHIKDKKEKIIILKIAEKYLQREKQKIEMKALEENIRLKQESLKSKKLDESQNLGVLKSSFKSNELISSNSLPYLMADLMVEFNKENISFNAINSSVYNPSRSTYRRYEAVLNRGVQSVPLLKLPPLSLLDSPPRKVRSVGNLLSPPKQEWPKENSQDNLIKPLHSVDSESQNVSTPDVGFIDVPSTEIEKEEDKYEKVRDVENQDLGFPTSADILDQTENETLVDDSQTEMEFETQISEARIDPEENTKTENIQSFDEAGNVDEQCMKEVDFKDVKTKSAFQLQSIDFTYEPRSEKSVAKGNENLPPESKSPYFASSYMNFMEVPQKSEGKLEKERTQKVNEKAEFVKDKIPVVDLTDDEHKESKSKQGNESELKNIYPREEVVYPIDVDPSYDQQHSFTTQSSGMEVDDVNTSLNSGSVYFSAEDKGVENDKYKTDNNNKIQESPVYPINQNELHSFQSNVTQDDSNLSYQSPMEFSQVSYADSLEYPNTSYAPISPDNRSFVNSPPYLPSPTMDKHDHSNIFGSPSDFNYAFAGHPQQSSASALFGSSSSPNTEGKERKQSEVFNFSFDTKSKTPTMFKLF